MLTKVVHNMASQKNKLYVTYCSSKKKPTKESIPAIERYNSDRIRWVYNLSLKDDADFAILSGVFGLVFHDEKIPYYDLPMIEDEPITKDDIERIARLNKCFLNENKARDKIVHYFTENPKGEPGLKNFYKSLKQATDDLKRKLELRLIQKRSYEEIELSDQEKESAQKKEKLFEDCNSSDQLSNY